MSISPGSRVGPYEVTSQLGEGGMGVVFRGRDSRLQRDVALKVLPDQFSSDPDRLSRFEREAQVLASLNHQHIAQIYGLEQVEGATCIVMELVEGETLEDRLKKGPLSSDEALEIARQIAEALATAHERGIVHRDLKPANIKLTPNGTVKVLDFGLAKALGPKTSETNMSMVPTIASGSIIGAVVGTPGYMSPEQARGKDVDARTDIWAFGCVLYEMLTARQAFEGETVTDVMAKIVTAPPDLDLLPSTTPQSVRTLLSCLLNKNASQRLQHIGDTRLFLDGTLVPSAPSAANATEGSRGKRGRLVIASLVAALFLLAIPAVLYFRNTPAPAARMRLELTLPSLLGTPVISPDGRTIAYTVQPQDGRRMLWLRSIDSENAQQVGGTEDASGILWSRDSKRIAIVAEGRLAKIEVASGNRQVLGQVGGLRGGDWNRSGVILLARTSDNVISRISDNGGEITPITKLNPERKETLHGLPVFLPDGNHFVYVAVGEKVEQDSSLYVASLDPNEPPTRLAQVHPNRFNGMAYVDPGYLVILNNGKVTAQRLDARGSKLDDEASILAEEVEGGFSVSNTGLLMYRKAVPQAGRQLLWFDRNGKPMGQLGGVANYVNVDLSPNGDRAAVDILSSTGRDVWVIDVERSVPARISFDPGSDWTASWSRDGSKLTYASTRLDKTRIYQKSSTGAGAETELPTDTDAIPVHWSPDDRYIVYSRNRGNTRYDTWLKPLFGDGKPIPYLESPFDKMQVRVSPDGQYAAYATNESGAYQIVVSTFPNANGGKWPISAAGGIEPKWRRDGRELYYLALDGKLMAVPISGPGFKAGRPEALFQTPIVLNRAQPGRDRRYDMDPNGRFLFVTPAATPASVPMTVLVNWNAVLEK
jgi:eukaryotic-like serine/threonine-protein kinase